MSKFIAILLLALVFSKTALSQETLAAYRSIGLVGNIPLHCGENHFAEDLNLGYGVGVNFRIPIYDFGITGQWQSSYHAMGSDALFHVNTRQIRNRLYTAFFGYSLNTAHGIFEPRINISRLTTRYTSDYRTKQILYGLGLKYGLGIGDKGLYLSTSIDYLMNASQQIVAPEHLSKYMNQSQTLLINLGLEWRFSK